MTKWEYKTVTLADLDYYQDREQLKSLGELGWELIVATTKREYGPMICVFKRPLNDA